MKRLITTLAAAGAAFMFASAALAADINLGFRGNLGFNTGSKWEGRAGEPFNFSDNDLMLGFGLAVYANFGLTKGGPGTIGIQPELNFHVRNGVYYDSSTDVWFTGMSFDVPVLFTYRIPINSFMIGFGIGPYLSVPCFMEAHSKNNYQETITDYKNENIDFGFAFDINFGINFRSGRFIVDLRYVTDLTVTKASMDTAGAPTHDVFTRRNLLLGFGYEFAI